MTAMLTALSTTGIVALSVSGAVASYLLHRVRKACVIVAVAVLAAMLALNTLAFHATFVCHNTSSVNAAGSLTVDPPGVLVAELIVGLAFLVAVYSAGYMEEYSYGAYYPLLLLFAGSMVGMCYTLNILLMLLFLEISSFFSAVLVLHGERGKEALRATVIYLAVSILETIFVIAGLFVVVSSLGMSLAHIASVNVRTLYSTKISGSAAFLAGLLFMLGFGTKASLFPFGLIWLPPAHSEAPAPVSCLLSGVMIKTGFLAMLRCLHPLSFSCSYSMVQTLMLLTLLSAVTGCVGMIVEKDVKRILAFSSIVQMSYVVLGVIYVLATPLGLSSEYAVKGMEGCFYHIVNHSILKPLLFMVSGVFWHSLRVRDYRKLAGAARRVPLSVALWFLAAISLGGLFWPTAAFMSKHLILECCKSFFLDPLTLKVEVLGVYGLCGLIQFVAALVTFITLINVGIHALWMSNQSSCEFRRPSTTMLIPMVVLAVLCILAGAPGKSYISRVVGEVAEYYLSIMEGGGA